MKYKINAHLILSNEADARAIYAFLLGYKAKFESVYIPPETVENSKIIVTTDKRDEGISEASTVVRVLLIGQNHEV